MYIKPQKIDKMLTELIASIREYFSNNYPHVDMGGISDATISKYMERYYIKNEPFRTQMDCLYDYIVSQDLADIQE